MPCGPRSTCPGSSVAVTISDPRQTGGEPRLPSRLNLPGAGAHHRDALAVGGHAVDVDLERADHEVDVRTALVHPLDVLLADRERKAAAERDVTRRVLVEQRVVEDGAERTDAALLVDERHLSQPQRFRIHGELGAQGRRTLVGLDLDRAAALEADAE